ncbi:MAG: DNA-3-methyladenine glycosylase I [Thermoplasmata archaeon]|nr:DNA-3-methyladenine glycosylase I [Thermoplasmata archaeon]
MSAHAIEEVIELFREAEVWVRENFPEDLEWSERIIHTDLKDVTKQWFYNEYVHCVYCAGFSVRIVRMKQDALREAYYDYDPVKVAANPEEVRRKAMRKACIRNKRKVDATIKAAGIINKLEWPEFLYQVKENINLLKILPYIADVLKFHLARNIGFNLIKPDVHIKRLAKYYGLDPFEMCEMLSEKMGLPRHTVDSVLWRAAQQKKVPLGSLSESH